MMQPSRKRKKIQITTNEIEIFCYSNSVDRLMETERGLKTIFKLMAIRYIAAALLRAIPVSSNSTFFMRKLKTESFIAYLHGPLTGTYSRPDELISYHQGKFVTV